jgi:hypothetical protein
MTEDKSKDITREFINAAIDEYLNRGGKIKQITEQKDGKIDSVNAKTTMKGNKIPTRQR